jgi:transcriptional regulator with XRE-family HTH domain
MNTYEERFEAAVAKQIEVEMFDREQAITQQQLADALGMERATLNRYLRGKRSMPMPVFFRVAQILGLAPEEIISRAKSRMGD